MALSLLRQPCDSYTHQTYISILYVQLIELHKGQPRGHN